jgi:signal transduction histidine kinase
VYFAAAADRDAVLQRFDTARRLLAPADWPASMEALRAQLSRPPAALPARGPLVVRVMFPAVWDTVPALVIPAPVLFLERHEGNMDVRMAPRISYTVLLLDREYIAAEMLPALAQQHFRQTGDGFDYQIAVVSTAGGDAIYHSAAAFAPTPDAKVDAAVDLFDVRTQEFGAMAAEIRRFSATLTGAVPGSWPSRLGRSTMTVREKVVVRPLRDGTAPASQGASTRPTDLSKPSPFSVIVRQNGDNAAGAAPASPRWRLLVKHPSGSLEASVSSARRRNLLVSSSILAVLGASVGLLMLSTRRAQDLARQQMEFVAAVSHELRTPLAVIRSAGDNLADGVVRDPERIRKYGDLVRNEGRRLTDMVEEILELAGIESGQRGFALRPVAIPPMLGEIVESSRALLDAAAMQVEYRVSDSLPPVLGDEAALRRVFQNLIANAIKYGDSGRWLGLDARPIGREIHVTVADRGRGIASAEQPRVFEPFYRSPDVIAARVQGAGLGLSLVKRMVEAHGGRVVLRSTAGAGSEFIVVLPAAGEKASHPIAAGQAPPEGSTDRAPLADSPAPGLRA